MNNKKIKIISSLSFIMLFGALSFFLVSEKMFTKNTILGWILIVIGFAFCILACLGLGYSETQKKVLQQKQTDEEKVTIKNHYQDSVINEIIYELENQKLDKLNEVIKKTTYETLTGYDKEDNLYYLLISNLIFGNKNIDPFVIELYKNDTEEILLINDQKIDVSIYSKEEIIDLMIDMIEDSIKDVVNDNENIDFEITNPKSRLLVYLIIGIVSLLLSVVVVIICLLEIVSMEVLLSLFITGIFIILSIIGIIAYFREKFSLQNGVYTYRGIFKSVSCKAEDVKKVVFKSNNEYIFFVTFMDKNDQKLMKFSDDGTAFRLGQAKKSFNYYGIKTEYK